MQRGERWKVAAEKRTEMGSWHREDINISKEEKFNKLKAKINKKEKKVVEGFQYLRMVLSVDLAWKES